MVNKREILILLLIFMLDVFVFALSPGLIDYFWYVQEDLYSFI
jgi:hypothetical protein